MKNAAGAAGTTRRGCEKVGQGAGWLQRVWKLERGRTWIPLRMQLDANVECGCEEVDVVAVNVGICSLSPPPVSHNQKLLGEKSAPWGGRSAAAALLREPVALKRR